MTPPKAKSYESRTYNVSDFLEWERNGQLELNPRFQRRAVWTEKAKSYLMDTILRGKPMPKVFIRQTVNVSTKTSMREVIDGQQRLRAILSYLKDGFVVSKLQNPEFGGMPFSQLDEDVQRAVLAYDISVDLLVNMPDSEVLDIFSRLNSYAVVLNLQEQINANHFGPFKVLADNIGHSYNDYWTEQRILTSKQILRMQEVSLVADLLIAMVEGIKSKKQVKKYYDLYENKFDQDTDTLEKRFDAVIGKIDKLFPEGLATTEFHRPHVFYSLFTAVACCLFGLHALGSHKNPLEGVSLERARIGLDRVSEIFDADSHADLDKEEREFLDDSRRATTDEAVRERRTKFLLKLIG